MDPILRIAHDYDLRVIEDCAEAHGALYKGKLVGSFGDAGCYSFYANKLITSGEGGMVTVNDDEIASLLRHYRAYYFDDEKHFWHKRLAWNLRMSALEAALGKAQLERLDSFIEARLKNAAYYTEHLQGTVELMGQKDYATVVSWMYGILLRDEETRNGLQTYLAENGVETRTFFLPMNRQPLYKTKEEFPVADDLGGRGMYLPSSSHLTDEEKDTVIRLIKAYLSNSQ